MGMSVIVDDKDPLNCPAHAKVFIVVLQALETCRNGRVLFRLRLLRAEKCRKLVDRQG